MAINSTFYLNAADLATATAVYLDSALSLIAPDGFYGDGTISRQQSSGILLTASACPSCGTPCGTAIAGSGGTGLYLLNSDTGSTPSDIGAIIIKFDPQNVPDGIKVDYNGSTYNTLSSPVDGLHKSTDPTGFTIVGNSASDCGLAGVITNIPAATEYLYNGTSFVATGNTQSITINPGDVDLGPSSPGECVMVIPKTTATPNIINFKMLGPCGSTAWTIDVSCPDLLPSFSGSTEYGSSSIPCGTSLTQTYYFAKVHTDADSYVGLYDYIFLDAFGSAPLSDGHYLSNNVAGGNKVIEVKEGIVIAITNCV
jgi:hypothetical protein